MMHFVIPYPITERTEAVQAPFSIVKAAGVFHTDNLYRDAFAYDVMEAVRSDVDEWLLDFVENHVFSKKEFYE